MTFCLNTPRKGRVVAEQTMTPPLLLTAREAAKALSICERTLFSLTKDGEVDCIRIGRSVRYAPRALEAFIDRRMGGAA